jgi:hypothetical protein
MEKVEVYKTKDGSLFADYTQARVHEECAKHMPEINAFIASSACKYNNCAHRKIVQNTLLAWIFWKADGGMNP